MSDPMHAGSSDIVNESETKTLVEILSYADYLYSNMVLLVGSDLLQVSTRLESRMRRGSEHVTDVLFYDPSAT